MPKEYDYSQKYVENDPNVKFRKCKGCDKIKNVEEFEVKYMCSPCYTHLKGKKRCNKCYLRRPVEYFVKGKKKISTKDGYINQCKFCISDYRKQNEQKIKKQQKEYAKKNSHKFRQYANERRVLKKKATIFPELKGEIEEFYKNCPDGFEVDHIFPLKHEKLCGLHVPWNLQYLTKSENQKKKNNLPEIESLYYE
jgi:hypothetical protein